MCSIRLIQVATTPSNSTGFTLYIEITPAISNMPQRIQFAPGTTSATVNGNIAGGGYKYYMLQARAGQTMSVDLRSMLGNAGLTIYRPDGDVLAGTNQGVHSWSGTLPLSGDYLMRVEAPQDNIRFSLTVAIV